jgi:Mg/Co/Ni transporter MgtE
METKFKAVTPEADQQVVAELISKYNLLAIPVTDENGELQGIVTIDDIIDILLPPSSRKRRRSV